MRAVAATAAAAWAVAWAAVAVAWAAVAWAWALRAEGGREVEEKFARQSREYHPAASDKIRLSLSASELT